MKDLKNSAAPPKAITQLNQFKVQTKIAPLSKWVYHLKTIININIHLTSLIACTLCVLDLLFFFFFFNVNFSFIPI